jgi:putative serine protease PepD
MNERPNTRGRGRRRRAAAILVPWLLGGLFVAGVLALTGRLTSSAGGSSTTVVRESAATEMVAADTSESQSTDTEALYAAASPAVVEIKATVPSEGAEAMPGSPFGGPRGEAAESTATGSGFVVDEGGTVVTAAHVVDEASSVAVTLQDGTTRKAEVLGEDDATDVAVIRFDPSGLELQTLELGDSAALKVGASVAAIGAPFEYAWSLSTGIVSGLDRTIEAPNGFTVAHAIQTDAAVNPGNSGGPLLDSGGKVIGVVDQIATDGSADQSSGVGFAVPSDLVASELEELEAGETVRHAYLGVATESSAGSAAGAEVEEVVAGSPAAEAGVKEGDVVTAVDGGAIGGTEELVAAIAAHKPETKITIDIDRGSESLAIEVRLGIQPPESQPGG